jgi:hypothetical protein
MNFNTNSRPAKSSSTLRVLVGLEFRLVLRALVSSLRGQKQERYSGKTRSVANF